MACSVRIASSITAHKFTLKTKYLPRLLLSCRHFSSKDDGSKEGTSSANDSDTEKQEKNSKGALSKSKRLRFKPAPVTEEMKESAKEKLKSLLSEITVTSNGPEKSTSSLTLAKAVKRISKKERLKQMEADRVTPEKEMDKAVKAVASSYKSDPEKVESELSAKLSVLNLAYKKASDETVKDTEDSPLIDEKINANLMSSVEEVAATISESPIPSRSKLTKRLRKLSLDQKVKSDKSMKSVMEGMVIESNHFPSSPPTSAEEKQSARKSGQLLDTDRRMPRKRFPTAKRIEKINIFDAKPLNIFTPSSEAKPDSTNTFWQKLQEKELRLLTQFAPANAFEEMILWTEQGKHWKFPIDNQAEMGAEENVGFHEHVFLEHHLKGFPTKGPIRHFMELVCVGLSKNPYITVERKIENIEWFRNYFIEKEELLRDAGAIEENVH